MKRRFLLFWHETMSGFWDLQLEIALKERDRIAAKDAERRHQFHEMRVQQLKDDEAAKRNLDTPSI